MPYKGTSAEHCSRSRKSNLEQDLQIRKTLPPWSFFSGPWYWSDKRAMLLSEPLMVRLNVIMRIVCYAHLAGGDLVSSAD